MDQDQDEKHKVLIAFLTTISYFQTLPIDTLNSLAAQFESKLVLSGEVLMKQGDEGDCLYVVQSGRLIALRKPLDRPEEILGDMRRGELIGELALFTEAPRAATVIAIRDSILWKLSKSSFDTFVHNNPLHIMPMVKAAMLRLVNPPKQRAQDMKAIALVPASNYPLNKVFVKHLIEEFKQQGTTFYLDKNSLEQHIPGMDLNLYNPKSCCTLNLLIG
ncbi:MAG: cyclic nucleotide-binding domain-containing protein [bacterium]|nr:cyclic nucleotide-binding domain-containing protein [bacterium]